MDVILAEACMRMDLSLIFDAVGAIVLQYDISLCYSECSYLIIYITLVRVDTQKATERIHLVAHV